MKDPKTCLHGKTFKTMTDAKKYSGVAFGLCAKTGTANSAFWSFVSKNYTFTVGKDGMHFTSK